MYLLQFDACNVKKCFDTKLCQSKLNDCKLVED